MRRLCGWVVVFGAAAAVACQDSPTVAPGVRESTIPRAGIVPGEYWQVTDLGTLDSGAIAEAVNDDGLIVGSGRLSDGSYVAFESEGGPLALVPAPVGTEVTAHDVNAAGDVTGSVRIAGIWHVYVRSAGGQFDVLPHFGKGDRYNMSQAMNDHRNVVGSVHDPLEAVLWTRSGRVWTAAIVGGFAGGSAYAADINNDRWVTGNARIALNQDVAFLKKPGQAIQNLGSLGGRGGKSFGTAINASGTVLGTSSTVGAGGEPRYFTWTALGGLVNQAGTTHRGRRGAISDKGRIAGSDSIGGKTRAFTQYQGVYAALPLIHGGNSSFAYGVNNCGVVVGAIYMNDGTTHAARWRRVVGTPPLGICD